MLNLRSHYKCKVLSLLLVVALGCGNYCFCPAGLAETNDLNFKVYNPDQGSSTDTSVTTPTVKPSAIESSSSNLTEEKPVNDTTQVIDEAKAAEKTAVTNTPSSSDDLTSSSKDSKVDQSSEISTSDSSAEGENKNKVLQGYVRVVPTGTKMSIIMDTAVDSDTSQEGDEFSARTAEDLTIDGTTAVPAGSVIRGRIATLNAPRHLNRTGSVALKFDSVTTPDNRQIPLVANLVARGGVVHARRGIRDIAMETGTFALPTAVALGIGAVAGHSSSSVGVGGGALIGAGVGAVIGIAILMAKKGKRVDVRPGDELKIELAEDLHMPTM